MAAPKTSPATKHLTKQYKELHDHPLFGIDAAPLETDLQTWCGNVFFPEDSGYPNLIVHFKLEFEDTYPTSSPKLSLCSPIDHTHVYFPRCCFSLLPDFRSYFEGINLHKTAYWNPTRTVRSFLESFYQFLVFDVDRESHGRGAITSSHKESAQKAAESFSCSLCGHTFKDPKPSRPQVSMQDSEKYVEEAVGKGEKLSEVEQAAADLNCSVCRKTIEQAIVGFGVNVEPAKNGVQITSDLYPLCNNCFYDDKVRTSAGGNPITHWIPFAVNDKIWKEKAFEKAQECFALIWTGNPKGFKPEIVFEVIGELWKTKAVEMMKGEEHASQKVLFGFCAFHHLLLAFANSIPELVSLATSKVEYFIADPKNRNKKACPDFGRFLPLFLISNVLWEDEKHAGRVCVSELFTRNAMWILKQHPALENLNDKDQSRITKSWEPSQVGLKLTCFQIRYLLEVGRPTTETDIKLNYERFNALYGRPTQQMVDQFQQTTKKVQAIADYPNWFGAMGLGKPPNEVILGMLQDAMKNSATQGYHGGNNNNRGGRGGRGRGRGGY